MKLWVRSSDKMQLTEIDNLSFKQIINGCWNINGNYGAVSLGSYPTRERCLEIIDEIQQILTHNGMILFKNVDVSEIPKATFEPFKALSYLPYNDKNSEVTVHNAELVVYEMPKK